MDTLHTSDQSVLSDYMPPSELAAQLGKSPRTVARWRRLGEGPPVTSIGRSPYYRRESVKAWLASQEEGQ